MITLQLKRTAKNISNNVVKDVVLANGEPLLVESITNTSMQFNKTCASQDNATKKMVFLTDEESDLLIIKNDKPLIGTTLFVSFENGNSVVQPILSMSVGYAVTFEYGIRYIDENGEYESNISNSQYNWDSNDVRVFVFDGNYWVIQLPSDYKENSYLFIGNGKDTVSSLYEQGTYISVSKYISDDMIKNGSITINKLDPNIDLASKEALQQISDTLDNLSDDTEYNINNINNKINLNKIYYTVCETSSNSSIKYVDVADLEAQNPISKYDGLTLVIKFINKVSIQDYEHLTLQVRNATGTTVLIPEKPLYVCDNRLSKPFYWKDNDTLIFIYNANYTGSLEGSAGVWSMASTSASSIIANWCYDNNNTIINGGAIATGSITADKIAANSITANEIAIGSLPSNVFSQDVQSVIGNLNQFKQQCASAGTVVAQCNSASDSINKKAYVTQDTLSSISVTSLNMPLVGTSVVAHFDYKTISDDSSFNNPTTLANGIYFSLTTTQDGSGEGFFNAPLGFIYDGNFVNVGTYIPPNTDVQVAGDIEVGTPLWEAITYYRWGNSECRTLMYDGEHWILSITTEYLTKLAEYCLNNNQTWIGGGTIVTGTIVADQIQSGSIDTSKVSLVCYGTDNVDDVMNYGGFGAYTGSTGSSTTVGVWMYGSTKWGDTDGIPDYHIVITNEGLVMNIKNGYIRGYGNKWLIKANSGVEIDGTGHLKLKSIPNNDSGLASGEIYSDGGTLKIKT